MSYSYTLEEANEDRSRGGLVMLAFGQCPVDRCRVEVKKGNFYTEKR